MKRFRCAALFAAALLLAPLTTSASNGLGFDDRTARIATYVGNPINVATGNKYQAESDVTVSSLLEFSRHYNSQQTLSGAIGPYWTHTYSGRVSTGTMSDGTRVADVLRPTGRQLRYRLVNGAWVGDPNVSQILVALTDAGGIQTGWEWRNPAAKRSEQFDLSGRLVKIRLQDGRWADVTYNGSGLLERVQQDDGRGLEFEYDASNRIGRVVTPDGQETILNYDSLGRLSDVLYPGGATRTYIYNESANTSGADLPNVLTGILHDGVRYATYGYDTQGLAVSTEHAGGVDKYTVVRNADGTASIRTPTGSTEQRQFVTNYDTPTAKAVDRSCTDDCSAASIAYQYDGNGYVSQKIEAGVTTNLTNDAQGNVIRKVEAVATSQQRTTEVDWDISSGMPVERRVLNADNSLVQKTVWTLNSRGQVRTHTQSDPATGVARTMTNVYCEQPDVDAAICPRVGLLIQVDGSRTDVSDVTTFTYRMADAAGCDTAPATCAYRRGDLWKVTNAKGQVVETLSYDGTGRPLSVRGIDGVVTDTVYTERGWLKATKRRGADASSESDDAITEMDYWPSGLVKRITQPDGSYTFFEFDDAERLKAVSNSVGDRIDYVLDAAGNRKQEDTKDAQGTLTRTLSRVYDQLGRLRAVKDAYSYATWMTYDARGNLDVTRDAKSRAADSDVDPLNRLAQTLQDVGGIAAKTTFQYDVLDNVRAVTDPKQLSTNYTYNALGDLTKLVSPDSGTTNYTYDSAGNLKTKQDARGTSYKATYAYDALNRLTGITYATTNPNLNVTYVYDIVNSVCSAGETFATGRLAEMTDGSGTSTTRGSTKYCYDRFGNVARKVQTTNGKVFTTVYQYAPNGHLLAMTYPSGMRVAYGYDAAGRQFSVSVTRPGETQPETLISNVKYLPFGPISELSYRNGARIVSRQHDKNYRPMIVQDSTGVGLKDLLGWDEVGNVTSLSDTSTVPLSTPLATYKYDGLNRLKGRYAPSDQAQANPLQGYDYDATGNRISDFKVTGTGTTAYTYPAASHRLTQVGSTARTYNAMGSLLTGTVNGVAKTFTYDVTGRMASAANGNKVQMYYAYNGRGEQVRRYPTATSTAQTYEVYNEAGQWIGEYDSTGPTGPKKQEFIWLGDLPVGVSTLTQGSTSAFQVFEIQADHLGTPRVVIDAARNKAVWSWPLAGEAFGKTAPNQDPDGDARAFAMDMRFPGQRFDAASGLNYNYFRDYENGTGRYVESDPIGLKGDIATFSYVANKPLVYVDANGLEPVGPKQPCSGGSGLTSCDGNGGYQKEVCTHRCYAQCTSLHEDQHLADFRTRFPTKCRGKQRGESPWTTADMGPNNTNPLDWYRSECRADRVGKKCAEDLLNGNRGMCVGPDCESDLRRYIKDIDRRQRDYKCREYGW